jgi:hypothetical protein
VGRPLGLSAAKQERLRILWNESGLTNDEIAREFGWVARGPLQRWVERLGLDRRGPYSHTYVDDLRRRVADSN